MYPLIPESLNGRIVSVYCPAMDWQTLRAHYEGLFAEAKKRGETQETVARRGGLRQNKISKLLDIQDLGPQVETFVRAIEGLGLTPSEFFFQIERAETVDSGSRKQALHSRKVSQKLPAPQVPGEVASDVGGRRPLRCTTPAVARAVAQVLIDAATTIMADTYAGPGAATEQSDRSLSATSGEKQRARKRRA